MSEWAKVGQHVGFVLLGQLVLWITIITMVVMGIESNNPLLILFGWMVPSSLFILGRDLFLPRFSEVVKDPEQLQKEKEFVTEVVRANDASRIGANILAQIMNPFLVVIAFFMMVSSRRQLNNTLRATCATSLIWVLLAWSGVLPLTRLWVVWPLALYTATLATVFVIKNPDFWKARRI